MKWPSVPFLPCVAIHVLIALTLYAAPVAAERVISVKDDVVILLDTPRDRPYTSSASSVFRCTARQGDDEHGEVTVIRTFTRQLEFPSYFVVRPPKPWHVSTKRTDAAGESFRKTFRLAFSISPGGSRATQKNLEMPADGVFNTLTFGLEHWEWRAFAQVRSITMRAFGRDVTHERLELTLSVNGKQIDAGLGACHAKALAATGPL